MTSQPFPNFSGLHFAPLISYLPAAHPSVPVEVLEQVLNVQHGGDAGSWPAPENTLLPWDRLCCRCQKSSPVSLVLSGSCTVTLEGRGGNRSLSGTNVLSSYVKLSALFYSIVPLASLNPYRSSCRRWSRIAIYRQA